MRYLVCLTKVFVFKFVSGFLVGKFCAGAQQLLLVTLGLTCVSMTSIILCHVRVW
ncbi:Annexin D5, partial [Zea mays]